VTTQGREQDTEAGRRADGPGVEVNRQLLASGVVLVSVGAVLGTMGGIAMTAAVVGAARTWVRELDEPTSVTVRRTLAQARATASAGVQGWRDANSRADSRADRRASSRAGAGSARVSSGIDDG
jgi:hypothetical protein